MSSSRILKLLVGGAALVGLGLGTLALSRQGDAAAEADVVPTELAVPVEVVASIRGSVAKTLSTSSTIEAEQSADVLAKVGGVVTEVLVGEGQRVAEGDVLARLDSEEKLLALEKAQLTLKKTEAELNRSRLSHEQQLISNFDYEKAIFERDLAAAELEVAELELR